MRRISSVAVAGLAVSICFGVTNCEAGFVSGFKEGLEAGFFVVLLFAFGAFIGWGTQKSNAGETACVCENAVDCPDDTTTVE